MREVMTVARLQQRLSARQSPGRMRRLLSSGRETRLRQRVQRAMEQARCQARRQVRGRLRGRKRTEDSHTHSRMWLFRLLSPDFCHMQRHGIRRVDQVSGFGALRVSLIESFQRKGGTCIPTCWSDRRFDFPTRPSAGDRTRAGTQGEDPVFCVRRLSDAGLRAEGVSIR
jgi:hypothetical protein